MSRKTDIGEITASVDDARKQIDFFLRGDSFFEYDYQNTIKESLKTTINLVESKRKNLLFKLLGNRGLKEELSRFQNDLDALPKAIDRHNENLAKERIRVFKETVLPVENRTLDDQQIYSAVFDVRNRLVIAGAGTGKTTTVVGLVKYLVSSGVDTARILAVSFTNASVDELRGRIRNETRTDVDTYTFHKLALNIISEVNGKRPNISHIDLRLFVSDTLRALSVEPYYANRLQMFLRFGNDRNDETDLSSKLKIHTMRGETVKSRGEKDIADYLYLRGITYVYEDSYKYDVSDENHTQYHPDFHISGTDVYIEYFGIDENGKTAPFVSSDGGDPSEEYNVSIEWKKQCHEENNTVLIPLYYHQFRNGTIFDELQNALDKHGISSESPSEEIILKDLDITKDLSGITNNIVTSLMIMKSCNASFEDLEKTEGCGSVRMRIYLDLLQPLYEGYRKALEKTGEIDFEDMLNIATDMVKQGRYQHGYEYVIVDEYQDISTSRYNLLKALRTSRDYRLYCVGDDWQSIYRFNGSDVGYIQDFERFWGPTKICRIEKTYRFSGKALEVSGKFIQKNPCQIKKELRGPEESDTFVRVANVLPPANEGSTIEKKLAELPSGSTVLILGRYTFDINSLENAQFRRNPDGTTSLIFKSRQDLDVKFMTIHGSKGLQADYVFIINCKNDTLGFPNKAKESPLIPVFLENREDYPFAEERRLFYVAMTRAKKGVYLVLNKGNVSPFVNDLFDIS